MSCEFSSSSLMKKADEQQQRHAPSSPSPFSPPPPAALSSPPSYLSHSSRTTDNILSPSPPSLSPPPPNHSSVSSNNISSPPFISNTTALQSPTVSGHVVLHSPSSDGNAAGGSVIPHGCVDSPLLGSDEAVVVGGGCAVARTLSSPVTMMAAGGGGGGGGPPSSINPTSATITPLSTARVTHAGRNITYSSNANANANAAAGSGRVTTPIPSSLPLPPPQQQSPRGVVTMGGGAGADGSAAPIFSPSPADTAVSLGSGIVHASERGGGGGGGSANQGGNSHNNGGSGLLLGSGSSMALLFPSLPTTTPTPSAAGEATHATAGGHHRPSYVPYTFSSNPGGGGLGGGGPYHHHPHANNAYSNHYHNNSISSGLARHPQQQQAHAPPPPCQSSPQLPSSSGPALFSGTMVHNCASPTIVGGGGGGGFSMGALSFQQPPTASPSLSAVHLPSTIASLPPQGPYPPASPAGAAVGLSASSTFASVASFPPMRFHFASASSASTPLFGAAPPAVSRATPVGLGSGRGVCSTPLPHPPATPCTLPSSSSLQQGVVEPSTAPPPPVIVSLWEHRHHHNHAAAKTNTASSGNNPAHFSSCTSFYNTSLSAEERVAFSGRRPPAADGALREDRRVGDGGGGDTEEQERPEEEENGDTATEGATTKSAPPSSPLSPQKQAGTASAPQPPQQQQATAATISSLSAVVMGIGATVFLAGCCSPLLRATSNSIMAALLLTEDEASRAFSEYNRAVTSYDQSVLGSVDEGSVSISASGGGNGGGQSALFRRYRRAVPTVEGDAMGDMVANPATFEVLTAYLSTKQQRSQQGGGGGGGHGQHHQRHRDVDGDGDSSSSFRRHTSGVDPLRRVSVAFSPPYKTVAGSHFGAEGNDLYRDMAAGEGEGEGGAGHNDHHHHHDASDTDKGIIGDDERVFTGAYRTPRGDLVSFEPFTVSLPPLEREVTKYFVCNKTAGDGGIGMCSPSDGIAWCNAQSPFAVYTPSTTTAASRWAMTLAARLGGTQCPRGSVCGECSWTERLRSVCFYLSMTDERPLLDRNGLNVPARVAALLTPPSEDGEGGTPAAEMAAPSKAGAAVKQPDHHDGDDEGERTTAEVALDAKTKASASRHLPRKGSKSISGSIPPPRASEGSKGVVADLEQGAQQRSDEGANNAAAATPQHDAKAGAGSAEDTYAAFHRLHPHLRETVVKHYYRRYMLSSTEMLGYNYPFHEATYAAPTIADAVAMESNDAADGDDDASGYYDASSRIAFHLRLDNDPYMAASRLTHGTFKVPEDGRPAPHLIEVDPKGQTREQLVAAAIKAMEIREKRRLREEKRAAAAAAGGPTIADADDDDREFSSNHSASSSMTFARLALLLLGGNAFLIGFAMLCLSRFIAAYFGSDTDGAIAAATAAAAAAGGGGANAATAASDAAEGQQQQQQQQQQQHYYGDDGIAQLGIGLLSTQQQQQQQQPTQHVVVRGGQSHSKFIAPPSLMKGRLGAASLVANGNANATASAPRKREGGVNNTNTDDMPESISSTCFGTAGANHQQQQHPAKANVRHHTTALLGGCGAGGDDGGSAQSPYASPMEGAFGSPHVHGGAQGKSRYGLSSAGSPMLN